MVIIFFFFQAEDGIRDIGVTGVQTCALPIFQLRELVPLQLRGGALQGLALRVGEPLRAVPPRVLLCPTPYDIALSERLRSEERRVGKECRSRWSPYH